MGDEVPTPGIGQMEYLIHGGRYASCVPGRRTFFLFEIIFRMEKKNRYFASSVTKLGRTLMMSNIHHHTGEFLEFPGELLG